MPRNFWHWRVSDIDHRHIGACCACSKCETFLFAPVLVIVLWPQYREKIAQYMLRAIAVLYFPICALKSCPAPDAFAAGAGHYVSLTAYIGWLVVLGLTALIDSNSVYIGPSPKEREEEERKDR